MELMKWNLNGEAVPFDETPLETPQETETVTIKGMVTPTDLVYTLKCPDVLIIIKKMGTRTAIRVEPVDKVDDNDLFVEMRMNTVPNDKELDKMIIKVKLAFDVIYKGVKDE